MLETHIYLYKVSDTLKKARQVFSSHFGLLSSIKITTVHRQRRVAIDGHTIVICCSEFDERFGLVSETASCTIRTTSRGVLE